MIESLKHARKNVVETLAPPYDRREWQANLITFIATRCDSLRLYGNQALLEPCLRSVIGE